MYAPGRPASACNRPSPRSSGGPPRRAHGKCASPQQGRRARSVDCERSGTATARQTPRNSRLARRTAVQARAGSGAPAVSPLNRKASPLRHGYFVWVTEKSFGAPGTTFRPSQCAVSDTNCFHAGPDACCRNGSRGAPGVEHSQDAAKPCREQERGFLRAAPRAWRPLQWRLGGGAAPT